MLWLIIGCGSTREGCADGQVYSDGSCVDYEAGDPVKADVWSPDPGVTWQWQITGLVDTSIDVEVYDIDLFDPEDAVFEVLSDKVVLCYFSAGSWEEWRADVGEVPDEAIGKKLDGWPDERWFDVTHPAVLDLMGSRLDLAVDRGCDGVEPDNVTAFDNNTGFPINATEQLQFNRWLADEAHARDLSVGLKNDLSQLSALEPWFDWALNEECHDYDECEVYEDTFLSVGKAVMNAEYVDDWGDASAKKAEVCDGSGLDTIVKTWDLGSEFLACD